MAVGRSVVLFYSERRKKKSLELRAYSLETFNKKEIINNLKKERNKIMLPTMYSTRANNGFFPSLFNEFFNDEWLMPNYHTTAPAVNVSEDDKEYKVEIAAPGMTKEDFHISLTNDDIVISMEKKVSNENQNENEKKYIRKEFSYNKFEQRFSLPEDVKRDNISAKMTDGVLYIDFPKMTPEEKTPETQYIEIK